MEAAVQQRERSAFDLVVRVIKDTSRRRGEERGSATWLARMLTAAACSNLLSKSETAATLYQRLQHCSKAPQRADYCRPAAAISGCC